LLSHLLECYKGKVASIEFCLVCEVFPETVFVEPGDHCLLQIVFGDVGAFIVFMGEKEPLEWGNGRNQRCQYRNHCCVPQILTPDHAHPPEPSLSPFF